MFVIPFFVGSNIVAVLTGIRRTHPAKLAVLLAIGIAGRLALIWWLAKAFEEPLLDVLDFLQRYQWWAIIISIVARAARQRAQLPARTRLTDGRVADTLPDSIASGTLRRMAEVTFRGNPIHTIGELPAVGSPAPAFTLTGANLG